MLLTLSAGALGQETACHEDSGAACVVDHGWILGPGGPMYTSFNRDGNAAVLDGDIRVQEITAGAASAIDPTSLWPNGVVPYTIHPDLPEPGRIFEAIDEYHTKTAILLVPRTGEEDYVEFVSGNGCSSYVGRQGQRQEITLGNIGRLCARTAVIHEIGHAIGLWHEHNRHDRDEHIDIHWENIETGQEHNFNPYPGGTVVDLGPYDFTSIMHYPRKAFSGNGQATIEPRNPLPPGVELGPGPGLSEGDIAGIASLYGPASGELALEDGTPAANLGAGTGRALHFTMEVPDNVSSLVFELFGGTGDADLYVRFGSAPTANSYDCRPFTTGSSENCAFDHPTSGTWHVMVHAYSSFSGVTLVGDCTQEEDASDALRNAEPLTGLAAGDTGELFFTMEVPANASWLNFQIFGGTGDADLYVKYGAEPSIWSYDCSPYVAGNVESCSFDNPVPGTWHVMVRAYARFSGVGLVGHYEETDRNALLLQTDLAASTGQDLHFSLTVPAGVEAIRFDISGGTGDADLYVRFGSEPTTWSYDCRPYVAGNSESCTFSYPAPGTWHVMVRAWDSFSGVAVQGNPL